MIRKADETSWSPIDARWDGEIYRMLVYKTGLLSRKIASLISIRRLDSMLPKYENYDIEEAAAAIAKEIGKNDKANLWKIWSIPVIQK